MAGKSAQREVGALAGMQDEELFEWIGKLKEERLERLERLVKELGKRKRMAEEHNRQSVDYDGDYGAVIKVRAVTAGVVAKEERKG